MVSPISFAWARTLCLLMAVLICGVSCRKPHEEAKKVKRKQAELNLPEKSAAQKKSSDDCLDWNMETTSDAYDKIGLKDKKWNSVAHDGLKLYAQMRAYGFDVEGFPSKLRFYSQRVQDLGCEDALMRYLFIRYGTNLSQVSIADRADLYCDASDRLENSQYPEIRKYYAAAFADGILRRIKPFPTERAKIYVKRAADHFMALLSDKKTPLKEIDNAGFEFLNVIEHWKSKKDRFDQMDKLLKQNWSKYGVSYLLEGQFYLDYAWKARGTETADKVTPEQRALFRERLALAAEALVKGMEVDPNEGRIPAVMIQVVSGQGKGLPEMKDWFEKAMAADPNNYQACQNLLHFLLPQWYGSREQMIAFGRSCVESEKWGGKVPLALAAAHDTYNREAGSGDRRYWRQPDVWPDIKASYEKFFTVNPKATSWRKNYATYAFRCGQWEAFNEQVSLMGDNIDYEFFGGDEEFNKLVKFAKEQEFKTLEQEPEPAKSP